jgi:hypothetical protein
MAVATPTSYSATSGATMRGGRTQSFTRGVDDGDSITSFSYQSNPSRWGLALLRCPPKMLKNFGVPSDTLTLLLARIQATIDFAVEHGCEFVLLRIGTNGVGSGDYATKFGQILDAYTAAGLFVFVCAVPPRGGADMRPLNTIAIAACAARPTMTKYVQDCDDLGDASYVADPTCFLEVFPSPAIHPNGKGAYLAGVAQAAILAPYFRTSPLVDASGEIAAQWVTNPLNTGTGGSGTGTVPSNISVTAFGTGTSAVSSIVAADADDFNRTPWLDIAPTFGASAGSIEVRWDMVHPSIAADFTAVRTVDCIAEVRLVSVNPTNLTSLRLGPDLNRSYIQSAAGTQLDGMTASISKTLVMRNAYERAGPSAYSANALKQMLTIAASGANSSVGHIQVRCASALGILQ